MAFVSSSGWRSSLEEWLMIWGNLWGNATNPFFFFLVGLGFKLTKQVLTHLSYNFSPFCSGYFGDEVSRTICPTGLEPLFSQSQPPK
jgi:hypothetical protein